MKRISSDRRWEKFNFLVENIIKDLSGSETKLLMVYYRHARVETNSKGVQRNTFMVSDGLAGEFLDLSPETIRDIRKRLIKRNVIRQVRKAAGRNPAKHVITEEVAPPNREGGVLPC